jgi:hypothetical protein
MKVGDLVLLRESDGLTDREYGYGIIVDRYEDDIDGMMYYLVALSSLEALWWHQDELVLISSLGK